MYFLLDMPYFYLIVDNGRCYVSRGYQALEDLNQNKDNPEYSQFCNSTHNGCFAFTGELKKGG